MSKKKRRGEVPEGMPDGTGLVRLLREMHRPMRLDDLLRVLGLARRRKDELEDALHKLEADGKVLRLRGGAWGLADQMKMVTGTLSIQRSGMGFVLPEDQRRTDIFIHPVQMGDAWHGDKVVAVLLPGRHGKNPEGRIVRILERSLKEIPVRVVRRMGKKGMLCKPADARVNCRLLVDTSPLEVPLNKDDLLLVAPGDKIEDGLWAGVALSAIGNEEDVSVQEKLVKINHKVPSEFPPEVLLQASTLPGAPGQQDFAGRTDLRHMEFVTIDGAKARDFDDAICVEEQSKGWRLWVAIADVSHYVLPGTPMDREALERSNSYYFPQSVEPMLPEALSNGLCSLNPRVPRLAMVAEMFFYTDGTPGKAKFYPAVIESKARLTYGQVQRALLLKEDEDRLVLRPVLPMLEKAEALARVLFDLRRARGTLDFDLPEPELTFNIYGETVDIRRKVRHFGHQLIEEFMIAANEAVARFLTEREAPFLYRVHPAPDPLKLEALFRTLKTTPLGADLPAKPSGDAFQTILAAARGTDQEFLISRLTLRCMMQARYAPEHEGHFGLASECYCHFTSPIRRYADLVVHRALKHALGLNPGPIPAGGKLIAIADQLSTNERTAMEAEREILKRLTVIFLRDKVGEEFTGIINGVTDFGFFVEFNEVLAEGMVRLSSLDDDYYDYDAERQELVGSRTGRTLRLGQPVKVKLTDVNVGRLEVNLALIPADGEAPLTPRRRKDGYARDRQGRGGDARPVRKERGGRQERSARGERGRAPAYHKPAGDDAGRRDGDRKAAASPMVAENAATTQASRTAAPQGPKQAGADRKERAPFVTPDDDAYDASDWMAESRVDAPVDDLSAGKGRKPRFSTTDPEPDDTKPARERARQDAGEGNGRKKHRKGPSINKKKDDGGKSREGKTAAPAGRDGVAGGPARKGPRNGKPGGAPRAGKQGVPKKQSVGTTANKKAPSRGAETSGGDGGQGSGTTSGDA